MIDNQNVNNNTNIDTNMDNETKKEICKITKINGASDANFASENFSTQNNYKNRRENAKYPADSEFGGDDNAKMYPQVYGYSKIMKYAPNSWLKDCGISFYKKKGVTISKQDVATSKELPGATLVLKNSKGEIVDKWVSTTTPHYIDN